METKVAVQEQKIFESKEEQAKSKLAASRFTADGFQNFALKLGVAAKGAECSADNAISLGDYKFNLVTRNRLLLEAAYRGSWIVGRVVNCVAEDMTRAGVTITTNEGAEDVQDFKASMSRLQLWQSLHDGIAWGRLYGGAIGVLQIDGQRLDTPLNVESIQKGQFQGIVTYDRWQINPDLGRVIKRGPNMGLPEFYQLVLGSVGYTPEWGMDDIKKAAQGGSTVTVHHSRCIRLGGIKLPYLQAITEMMWDESVLERLWDRLIEFDTASAAAGGLIQRANLRTIGVDGLREILAAGGKAQEALVEQFQYMRKFQSSEGITLIDKNDVFDTHQYSFSGLSDVLLQKGQELSGASEIPLVRLFGQSPAGLSATGESDLRNYYDSVNAKQESQLRNPLETIIKVAWASLTGKPAPKDLTFVFTPLWQMSATDKSTIATNTTNSIISAHDSGLVKSETAMKELKQASSETGLFTNITDEEIKEAEESADQPPMPDVSKPDAEDPAEKVAAASKDSAWMKIKRWVTRDDWQESKHPRKKDGEFGKGGSSASSKKSESSGEKGSLSNPEQSENGASKINEQDKDDAINYLTSRVPEEKYDAFMDKLDEAFESAKIGNVNAEEASKIKKSHNFTFETDPDNELMNGKKKNARGKEVKDPSIVIKFGGDFYALDGQHRLNKAIKSGDMANVAIVDGEFMKKFGITEKSFEGKKSFDADVDHHKKIADWVKKNG